MPKTDLELWTDVLAGDCRAWTDLVDRYKSLVYSVLMYHRLSQLDAADCFQQTWTLLYKNRKKLNDPSRLSAWLVTTAKREALHARRQSVKSESAFGSLELVDSRPLPDEELLQLERQAQMEAALRELDPPCRKVMEAFFFADEEKSYEDIARALGVSPNTLGAKRRRCLDKLKRILLKNGYLSERKDG
jgi:RNA polymerase sigma factor (sigma-70 family)